jgi:acetyltransferase-like isoleucine patch superfamily enzyme
MKTNYLDTPWKIVNEGLRLIIYPFVYFYFRINGIQLPAGSKIFGLPIIQKHRRSTIRLGKNLQLRSTTGSNPLGVNHAVILCTWQENARLEIGDCFGMTGGSICAAEAVKIGSHVIIGANTTITDTDFHPLEFNQRIQNSLAGVSKAITIEDEVFIGMHCLILKGVTIGRGSVIGAGSVVSRSIPPGVIAAGNPARVIKSLSTHA